jgi:SulP family sulfate permease
VNYRTEILAGLTVAMTMIPESLSFCYIRIPTLVGLYAAFIMGLVTAIFEVDQVWFLVVQGQQ